MMKKTCYLMILVIFVVAYNIEAKKISRSRSSGSGRSSSRKTNPNPVPNPTSLSYAQGSASKTSLFGWQTPAQKSQASSSSSSSRQSHTNNEHAYPSSNTGLSGNNQPKQQVIQQNGGHSYPSSNTGLSGNNQPKQQVTQQNGAHSYPSSNTGMSGNNQPKQQGTQQENMQRANLPSQQPAAVQNQPVHSYPNTNSLTGNSGVSPGAGYPSGTGVFGSNAGSPPYQGMNSANNYKSHSNYPQGTGFSGSNVAPPPYQSNYPTNSFSNTHQHPQGAPPPYSSSGYNHYNHPQGPPPPYYGHSYGNNQQAPGYFGNYINSGRNFGSVGRSGNVLTGVGIAGAGIGTVLTGLALWNLARSTGHHHHTVVYDNRGQPIAVTPDNSTSHVVDPILGDLVNCTLSITTDNATEVIAIPCSIATSFSPDANVKDANINKNAGDNTKCTVTVVTSAGQEFMTTIPCSILLNTAAENNVTEPIPDLTFNTSTIATNETVVLSDDKLLADQPTALKFSNPDNNLDKSEALLNCTQESGDERDPINPCFSINHALTVIPLNETKT